MLSLKKINPNEKIKTAFLSFFLSFYFCNFILYKLHLLKLKMKYLAHKFTYQF